MATEAASEDDPRFSATLTAAQRGESGLAQLTEDNVAVIDALVRQDETLAKRRNRPLTFSTFSQRRSDHERDIAGFARLSPEQIERLDALVARRTAEPVPQLTAELGTSSPAPLRSNVMREHGLDVHGSVSLMYGWSKAGSVRGGEITMSLQDPARRFSLNISYAEYHGKGVVPCFYPDDNLSRLRPTLEPSLVDR